MLTANIASQNGNYEKRYTIACFDEDVFRRAKIIFNEYHLGGVILNDSFEDSEWKLTNQLRNKTISFQWSEVNYTKNASPWIECSYPLFIDSVKTYIIFNLGSVDLDTLWEIAGSLRQLIELTEKELLCSAITHPSHITEFLEVLPGVSEHRDAFIEALEERQWRCPLRASTGRQRVLAEFGAYFRFNDTLANFWESAKEKEKLFWFPLYLWWTLTAILPLRTTEFLLTPRQCLSYKNGRTLIALRRSRLKGGGRKIAYKVDRDYEIVRYIIPDKMAGEIGWYLDATDAMMPTVLSTLFVREPHYEHFKLKPSSLGYYTYGNLSTCLRLFQKKIMGVEKVAEIHLGDTRHIAMISLILSGGSPLICKELAGHKDINISAHYYSNISSFIECSTLEFYRKSHTGAVEMTERRETSLQNKRYSLPVQGGFCDSEAYKQGEIDDCIKCMGIGGELGDCQRCPHFIDGKSGMHLLYESPQKRKEQVDQDSQYLLQTLEAVRRGIGLQEDIQSAILHLQQSCVWYRRSLQHEWEE